MADQLPTSNYYNNLGGINQKSSKYEMSTAQFLDLRNLDFDVPRALQQRPGSSQWCASAMSGPVLSLYEYQKSVSNSQVPGLFQLNMANAGGNVYFNNAQVNQTFTLLSSGWGTTQPIDFLTFANNVWMANGTKWTYYDGISTFATGLLQPQSALTQTLGFSGTAGAGVTYFTVFGITATVAVAEPNFQNVDFMAAYSYVRYDGYEGPLNVFYLAKNMLSHGPSYYVMPFSNALELMGPRSSGGQGGFIISGFTVPAGLGITAIALYFDLHTSPGLRTSNFGDGYVTGNTTAGFPGVTLYSNASVNFKFFTLIPTTTTNFTLTTNEMASWSGFLTTNPRGQSGMTFDWFATNTPKYIETSQNVMFAAGMSNAPSTVWLSNVGVPEFFDPQNSFDFRTNDGDQVYATKDYNNYVLVMKEHSFGKFIGDNVSDGQLVTLSTDYGCISNRTVITKDQTCFWLDRKGVLEFNGANWKIISDPVEGIFRRMNLTAAKEVACAVHNVSRSQLWWGIPVDGSLTNNITVVYDYLVGAWTFFDGFSPASFAYIKGQLTKPTAWRGDYAGLVHFTGESFFNDSGSGITCLGLPMFENDGGQNQTTIWRRFFLDASVATGVTGQIKGQVFSNYDTSTVRATFSMFQDQFQSRAEIGVVGKAVAVQFSRYSASLPLLINGYGLAKRGLRNV